MIAPLTYVLFVLPSALVASSPQISSQSSSCILPPLCRATPQSCFLRLGGSDLRLNLLSRVPKLVLLSHKQQTGKEIERNDQHRWKKLTPDLVPESGPLLRPLSKTFCKSDWGTWKWKKNYQGFAWIEKQEAQLAKEKKKLLKDNCFLLDDWWAITENIWCEEMQSVVATIVP